MNDATKLGLGIALVAIAATGCKNRDSALVGKWKASMPKSTGADSKNPLSGLGDAFASMMSVEFKADHTYSMTMMIIPMEGNWALSGNTVTLTPTKIMGKTIEELQKSSNGSFKATSDNNKPMDLTLSGDGKTMTIADPKSGQQALTFQKEN